VSTNPSLSNNNSAQKVSSPSVQDAEALRQKVHDVINMNVDQYTPIKSLNTFLFDWKIKARVTKKHAKKTWKNAKGEGQILNIELIDTQGSQILATFFNDLANKYDDELKENGVYLMSNGTIKIANQKYTSIKNDYCIVFDRNSEIAEVPDDENIKQQGFCFVTIDEINEFEQSRTVDTIGIITSVGQVSNFQPKNGGPSKDKRTLQIADESSLAIQVTLWGKNATKLELREGAVLAIRGARVSDYGGKTLNSGDEHSQIY
jgi:replication factor A1